MDAKHVKMVWTGRPRPQSQASVETSDRRRAQTPTMVIPRPLVRRHSMNGSSISKGKGLSLYTDNQVKHELPMYRGRRVDDAKRTDDTKRCGDVKRNEDTKRSEEVTKARESISRKHTTPAATRITSEPNIRPILKAGKDSSVSKVSNASTRETTTTTTTAKAAPIGADGKFCYRLPNRPEVKLRKSVSFRDDSFSSSRSSKRSSSPSYFASDRYSCVRDSQNTQIFV